MRRINKYFLIITFCLMIIVIFYKVKTFNSVSIQNRVALGSAPIEIPCSSAPSECGIILVNSNNNYTPIVLDSGLEMD